MPKRLAILFASLVLCGQASAASPNAPPPPSPEQIPGEVAKSMQDWFGHAVNDILTGVDAATNPQPQPPYKPRSH